MRGRRRVQLDRRGKAHCQLAKCEMHRWLPEGTIVERSLTAFQWLEIIMKRGARRQTLASPEERLARLLGRGVRKARLPELAPVVWVSKGAGVELPGISDDPVLCLAVLAKSSLKAFQAGRELKLRNLPAGRTLLLALPEGWEAPELSTRRPR